MPKIYVKVQEPRQMGVNTSGGAYQTGNVSYGVASDERAHIFRFTNVPVPKNSTINSATLHTAYSVKNITGTAYNWIQIIRAETSAKSTWLDPTVNELASRSWQGTGEQTVLQYHWVQGGPDRQIHSQNVKPQMDALLALPEWTAAGGSPTFMIFHSFVSHSSDITLHNNRGFWSPVLEIDYTPPVGDGKETVINVAENCNFNREMDGTGAFNMDPYFFNDYFGSYTLPTYAILSTPPAGVTAAPHGGKILEVSATTGVPMVYLSNPYLEDGEWYNISAFVYLPASTPAGVGTRMTGLGDTKFTFTNEQKGSWVRHNFSIIGNSNEAIKPLIAMTGSTTWNSSVKFYVANVQVTKGRILRPYIDGSRTMTNATYGWAGVNTGGFVRAAAPTVTVTPPATTATGSPYAVSWTYFNSAGHAQERAEIQVGRQGA